MNVASFVFSAWAENTYILYDDSKECCIVDPGCNDDSERQTLVEFIESNGLKPVKLVNTHCHICLLYTSPSPRDATLSRMPSSA